MFGNNFSFNMSAILIFSIFINLDTETLILIIGLIINNIISLIIGNLNANNFIQKYFCKTEPGKKINGLDSIQLFGFLTGYYSLNRYFKYLNSKWTSSFIFLGVISICFARIYIEEEFSLTGIVSLWFMGFLIGAFTGYLSGKSASQQSSQNNSSKDNTNNTTSEDDKSCSQNNQDDYICQAFKDGKVFETGS